MRERYTVELLEYEEDFLFVVFEHTTEQAITHFLFIDEATEYRNFLEGGGAFNGHTPAFMLIDVPIKDNINDVFSRLSNPKGSK